MTIKLSAIVKKAVDELTCESSVIANLEVKFNESCSGVFLRKYAGYDSDKVNCAIEGHI